MMKMSLVVRNVGSWGNLIIFHLCLTWVWSGLVWRCLVLKEIWFSPFSLSSLIIFHLCVWLEAASLINHSVRPFRYLGFLYFDFIHIIVLRALAAAGILRVLWFSHAGIVFTCSIQLAVWRWDEPARLFINSTHFYSPHSCVCAQTGVIRGTMGVKPDKKAGQELPPPHHTQTSIQ